MDIINKASFEKLLIQKWADFINVSAITDIVTSALRLKSKQNLRIQLSRFIPENNYFIIWIEVKVNGNFSTLECKLNLNGELEVVNMS